MIYIAIDAPSELRQDIIDSIHSLVINNDKVESVTSSECLQDIINTTKSVYHPVISKETFRCLGKVAG